MATIQEFNVDFKGNTQGLQNAIKGIKAPLDNLGKSFAKIGGIIAGAFAVSGGVKAVADLGNELANFEMQTGIAGDEVSQLGADLAEFGGSAKDAMADLDNLQKAFVESTQGQGALINATKKYGIQVSNQGGKLQNIEQTYKELQKSISKYDKAKQNQILKEMGLTDASIRMLTNKKNLEESFGKSNPTALSQDEIKAGKEFNNMLVGIKDMWLKICGVILKSVMPIFKQVFKFVQGIFNIFIRNGGRVIKILGVLVGILIAIKIVTIGISLAAQGVLWPITAIVAICIILLVIVDDIWTFFEGGESITGELVAKFKEWLEQHPKIKAFVDAIVAGFKMVWEFVKKAFDYIMNFSWSKFIDDLKGIGKAIYDTIASAISNAAKAGWNKFKGFFGFGGDTEPKQSQTKNTTNNVTINSTTNTNNPQVAKQAGDNTKKQLETATQQGGS